METRLKNQFIDPLHSNRGQRAFEIGSRKQQVGYMIDENGKAITFFSLEEKGLVSL